jgi:hypothetical protein
MRPHELYERAGMILTGKTAPLRSSLALQYESPIGAQPAVTARLSA